MGRQNPAAPTVDDLHDLNDEFTNVEGGDPERAVLDKSVATRVTADEIVSVEADDSGRGVTVTTTHLRLEASIDLYREQVGVVQVSERESDEFITDDVPPEVIGEIDGVQEVVDNARERANYDPAVDAPF